jgi:hypothetical protein
VNQRRVLVAEAAEALGISEGAVRMRVKRKTLPSTREGGRLYVLLNTDPTGEPERPHDRDNDRTNELIATLQEQLAEEREARRRADTIIAQLARTTEEQARTIRELEAPQDSDGAPDAPTDVPPDAPQAPERSEAGEDRGSVPEQPQAATSHRPWWRRVFGG